MIGHDDPHDLSPQVQTAYDRMKPSLYFAVALVAIYLAMCVLIIIALGVK
jgi:hypothetical protein